MEAQLGEIIIKYKNYLIFFFIILFTHMHVKYVLYGTQHFNLLRL